MAIEASDIPSLANGTTDQTITTTGTVTVQPTSDQAVTTTTQGPATLESAMVQTAERNPAWLLGAVSVVGAVLLVFCLWFVAYNTLRWVDGNNAHAGNILSGIAEPLKAIGLALGAFIVGWLQNPPRHTIS